MRHAKASLILAALLVAGCGGMASQRTMVTGAGPDDMLKLRAGPGLGYNIIMGLPDGTELTRHACVTEVGQLWCKVSLTDGPRVTGYVSADYLTRR